MTSIRSGTAVALQWPSGRQCGPECIYKLKLNEPSGLEISIDNLRLEGINNNIFLLTSLAVNEDRYAMDCIGWGDYSMAAELGAGTYYIVIDSGPDLPGEYTLEVSFR